MAVDPRNTAIIAQRGILRQVECDSAPMARDLSKFQDALGLCAKAIGQGQMKLAQNFDDRSDDLMQIDSLYKKTMDQMNDLEAIKLAIDEARNDMDAIASQKIVDLESVIQSITSGNDSFKPAETIFSEQAAKTKADEPESQKFADFRNKYSAFRSDIWDILHENDDADMPVVDSYYGDYDPEGDLEIAQERVSYKCPLTKQYYEDPVVSTVCGHAFSGNAIREVLTAVGGRDKCPVPACSHFISLAQLVESPELAQKAERARLRELKASQRRDHDLERL